MGNPQIVVSGSVALDRIMSFSGHFKDLIEPAKLHVLSVSVLVDTAETAHGGIGANISYNLAFLGNNPILLASAGNDASDYINALASKGVQTDNVHFSELGTASFNVLNDSEGNQVGGFYPGAMSDSESLSFEPFADKASLFWVAPHDPKAMRRQTDECVKLGLKYGYDPGQQVSNLTAEDLKAGVNGAEIVMINEYELEILLKKTGQTIEQLRQDTPLLVITHGEKGSEISGKTVIETVTIGAAKPQKIVDPGGAGDAYRGGFLHGYVRDWDLKKCGQLGAVMASFVIEEHGPQADFDKTAIIDRYKATFNEEINIDG